MDACSEAVTTDILRKVSNMYFRIMKYIMNKCQNYDMCDHLRSGNSGLLSSQCEHGDCRFEACYIVLRKNRCAKMKLGSCSNCFLEKHFDLIIFRRWT